MSRARGQRAHEMDVDVVPLTQRAVVLAIVRVVLTGLVIVTGDSLGAADLSRSIAHMVGYLIFTGLLSGVVLTGRRRLTMAALNAGYLLDVVVLTLLGMRATTGVSVLLALAAYLVSVCLLASFRTGLKLAVWCSIVAILGHGAAAAGLLSPARIDTWEAVVDNQVLLWSLVLITCTAAAVSERELRRRRLDADALRGFATSLHTAESTAHVADAVARFLGESLDATRVCVCRQISHRTELLAGHGLSGQAEHARAEQRSAFLGGKASKGRMLALRLDPQLDPWLTSLMPGARRVLALTLLSRPDEAVFVVVEHARQGGRRIDHRFVVGAEQAVATAALAFSRAELLERARAAASTDALTGVANRRVFDASLEAAVAQWRRDGLPWSLIMVDADHFKAVNDTHGHQSGDLALQSLARALVREAGPAALVARFGGEEFAVLLRATDADAAALVAERCRLAVMGMDAPVPMTASLGVAAVPQHARDAVGLLAAADAALFAAKEHGRNRVHLAGVAQQVPYPRSPQAPSRNAHRPR